VSFGKDEQTAHGDCWTGAKVVFAGHSGIDAATGVGRSRGNEWGPYEHLHPSQWKVGQNTIEAYRRTCTGGGWVAQALALGLLHAEQVWGHDAFFDYVDRWMGEDDTAFIKIIKQATGKDYGREWSRHGWAWQEMEAFVKEMWAKHRPALAATTDGWKQKRDDRSYRTAIEKSQRPVAHPVTPPRGPREPAWQADPRGAAEAEPREGAARGRLWVNGHRVLDGDRVRRVVDVQAEHVVAGDRHARDLAGGLAGRLELRRRPFRLPDDGPFEGEGVAFDVPRRAAQQRPAVLHAHPRRRPRRGRHALPAA